MRPFRSLSLTHAPLANWVAIVILSLAMAITKQARATDSKAAFQWPNGARAAVSLSYDDALDSQLDQALPALDRHNLKGSFFLQLSNPAVTKRMPAWRDAARNGHELGNHSLFHQCSRSLPDRDWVAEHRNLDTTSAAQMRDQVLLANAMLEAIDGRRERTYTAPCGDVRATGVDYLQGLAPAFVAIKSGGSLNVPRSMANVDPYRVASFGPVGSSGKDLIALVKEAGQRGTMVAFTFHGVGGDYLSVSTQAHDELLRFLGAHREEYWTDTFLTIMTHVKQEQSRVRAQR